MAEVADDPVCAAAAATTTTACDNVAQEEKANLLVTSEYADNGQLKLNKKRGGRRHKSQWMKKPMAISEVILELQDCDLRENALRCLSGHLIERREQDIAYYRNAAIALYYSCGTLAVLLQEIISTYARLYAGDLNVRGSKRLANVLTLFQAIAANEETRIPYVKAYMPNLLLPFILSTYTGEVYENIRAISLSIIDLLCKDCKEEITQWALESDIIAACIHAIEVGSRLSKVISMSILESMLRDSRTLAAVCDPTSNLAMDILIMLTHLVAVLAVVQDFSPRLVFHVVRSYILLCQHPRALQLVKDNLPQQLQDHTFHELKKVYPLFRHLHHQLLLNTGKAWSHMPEVSPDSENQSPATTSSFNSDKDNLPSSGGLLDTSSHLASPSCSRKASPCTPTSDLSNPLQQLDLNKQGWSPSVRQGGPEVADHTLPHHVALQIYGRKSGKLFYLQRLRILLIYSPPTVSSIQQPGGDEASNEGCNSGPTGHDFTDNSIVCNSRLHW